MQIKVLVVEDKISLNKSIADMLKMEGYLSYSATDVEEAKKIFLREEPHIILLDIMLPSGNGFDLISFFKKHNDSRIIMLTALDDKQSKRISYENGADDYLTKPFDLYELVYKLNAIRRRIMANLKEYKIGDISFNVDTNRLSCKEKEIIIQPSQSKFLKLLCDKFIEDSYVDKNEAIQQTSGDVDESHRLQTLVARLRKNLAYICSEQIDIETIYGKGYRIHIRSKGE